MRARCMAGKACCVQGHRQRDDAAPTQRRKGGATAAGSRSPGRTWLRYISLVLYAACVTASHPEPGAAAAAEGAAGAAVGAGPAGGGCDGAGGGLRVPLLRPPGLLRTGWAGLRRCGRRAEPPAAEKLGLGAAAAPLPRSEPMRAKSGCCCGCWFSRSGSGFSAAAAPCSSAVAWAAAAWAACAAGGDHPGAAEGAGAAAAGEAVEGERCWRSRLAR
jgi:hypothetical protein